MITKVEKKELLRVLAENEKKHKEEYDEAIIVYKEKAIEKLNDKIKRLEKGEFPNLSITLPQPKHFLKEYKKIYKMISMNESGYIELTEGEFSQYVLDDWVWKDTFLSTNSFYSAGK